METTKRDLKRMAYTVEETAEMLGIPTSTLYELVRRKQFPSLRLGRHIRITEAMIQEHLEKLADDNLF